MSMRRLFFNQTVFWISVTTFVAVLIYVLSFDWLNQSGFWGYRKTTILGTGVVAFALMSLCMVSSIRSPWLERKWGGLDKMFHLHKWAAIFAFVWVVIHWVSERGVKLLVQSGLFDFPPRVRGVPSIESVGLSLEAFKTPAKIMGEYGFYVLIAFVLCALLSKIPYKVFQKSHRYIAVLYIFIALHSVILMPPAWWNTPAAYLIMALALMGIYGAVGSIFAIHRKKRSFPAVIRSIEKSQTGIVELELEIKEGSLFQCKSGQFVFIDFSPIEGAHPFSIALINGDKLCFVIKPTGDFTHKMCELLEVGQKVVVEGPYGQFDFDDHERQQVWIAGGIGVAPFISRLQDLAQQPMHGQLIDFWYSTRTEDENNYPQELLELCVRANVRLHRVISGKDGYLDAGQIAEKIGREQMLKSSFWFCGPQKFCNQLRCGLVGLGVDGRKFHHELFAFR